jgi:hypothetical protein
MLHFLINIGRPKTLHHNNYYVSNEEDNDANEDAFDSSVTFQPRIKSFIDLSYPKSN